MISDNLKWNKLTKEAEMAMTKFTNSAKDYVFNLSAQLSAFSLKK